MNKLSSEIPDTLVDAILAYEEGNMHPDKVIQLFQTLIDTGLDLQLQGKYTIIAKQLQLAGTCKKKKSA